MRFKTVQDLHLLSSSALSINYCTKVLIAAWCLIQDTWLGRCRNSGPKKMLTAKAHHRGGQLLWGNLHYPTYRFAFSKSPRNRVHCATQAFWSSSSVRWPDRSLALHSRHSEETAGVQLPCRCKALPVRHLKACNSKQCRNLSFSKPFPTNTFSEFAWIHDILYQEMMPKIGRWNEPIITHRTPTHILRSS